MFKLQRLEITGFKSFADYTEIVFTGDGITAVVGPNGCGKSNVSDSIAWVLGEQRAKSLRGEEMKDVIFQGTSKRAPSGMAEVVLHMVADETALDEDELQDIDEALSEIDERAIEIADPSEQETETAAIETQRVAETNDDHSEAVDQISETVETAESVTVGAGVAVAPAKIKPKRHWRPRKLELDFMPGEAVSVTRRLYLSGESEYLLNGKTCRLRDIQDLFSGTGLSGAHYALIEQGRIGQILSAKPADRRTLIEEAAGISKFRTRQRAAEARLESAKGNLRRISDIVEEIDKQANSLRRQAAKTRRYKILREELRELLRLTFAAEGKFYNDSIISLEEKLEDATKREREIFWEVTGKDEAFRAATKAARDAEESLAQLRSEQAEKALRRDRASRELHYREEQTAALKSRAESLKDETQATEERLKLVGSEYARLAKDEQKQSAETAKEEENLRKAEDVYRRKISEVREIEAQIENIRGELMQHTAAVERLGEIEKQHLANIERLAERAEGLKREGARAGEVYEEHQVEQRKLDKELAKAREKSQKLREEKQKLIESAIEARENLQTSEKTLNSVREDYSRTANRLQALRELEERRAIYAPTVQTLFADQKKIGVEFKGTLADQLNVEAAAEKAVENILGNYLQTVLVSSEKDARQVIKYLDENNLGRTPILVFDEKTNAKETKKNQTVNRKSQIANLIGASPIFAALLETAFPREMAAELVENFDRIKTSDERDFVALGGEVVFGKKLFIGGKANQNEKTSSVLAFKRELRELDARAATLKKDLERAERETEKARKVLSEREDKIVDLQSFITQSERDLLAQEIQLKSIAQEIERAERHRRVVAEESKQIEKELADVRTRLGESKTNASNAEKARLAATAQVAQISEKLSKAREEADSENVVLSEKRTLAATAAERRRSVVGSLRRLENEQKELDSRLARLNSEITEIEVKIKETDASIADIKSQIENATAEETGEQVELTKAAENLKAARENSDRMSQELSELNRASAEARDLRGALEVQKAETVTRLQNLNEICSHELNLSLVELVETVEVAEDFDLETGRRQTDEMRRRIENFGAVNMLALEELTETEERLNFLTSQRQDIIDGIFAAEEALNEIKLRSRERFRQAFEAINGYFTEFFLELFGGGRGEMTLLDAEDVLESGIEIVAQPPGKRLQNILLLSGGEKAMTAIALVMAIFQYRPSPFCLLDEVDAPLDDANVGRFVDKIAQMSEKTQFIVITHNKRTMEAAKALYGVTMAEPGVSKLVSVKFE